MPFGGMPEMRPRKQDNRYYELLGVNRSSSDSEIKKAFVKLARRMHPDKGALPSLQVQLAPPQSQSLRKQ